MNDALRVKQLRKSYGNVDVLKNITFDVKEGEIFGILGPNGAGKSTTLECIEGVKSFNSGSIFLFGEDIQKNKDIQKVMGVQLQSTSLQQTMTVYEAMKFFCTWHNIDVRTDLLDQFGLRPHYKKQYGHLSIGQKRRLHLALALCNNPKMVVLDEPTAGLDIEGRMELHHEIRQLKQSGVTVLLASHDMAEVEMLCDRLALIVKGEIKFIGTPREMKLEGNVETKIRIKTEGNSLINESFNDCEREVVKEGYVIFRTTNMTKALTEIMAKLNQHEDEIVDLVLEELSLEERFMEVVHTEGKAI